MQMTIDPIGHVSSSRKEATDDGWDAEYSIIKLSDRFSSDCLIGLNEFSHIEVLFCFHGVDPGQIAMGARRPRGNAKWPATGIFAQRAKNRPNRIGTTMCRLLRVEGVTLYVEGLDAIDGSPVMDIKPVMAEFLPRGSVIQPPWSHELMAGYWLREPTA
jgi:tRNA (adenine37-N6)-methyltransferase